MAIQDDQKVVHYGTGGTIAMCGKTARQFVCVKPTKQYKFCAACIRSGDRERSVAPIRATEYYETPHRIDVIYLP